MSKCGKNYDSSASEEDACKKKLNDHVGNSSQTENAGEDQSVYKRPRGRPKLAKAPVEVSETSSNVCTDTKCCEKSSNEMRHFKKKHKYDRGYSSMAECRRETSNVEVLPRGRPKRSTELPETRSDQSNLSIHKRGRGRPKLSKSPTDIPETFSDQSNYSIHKRGRGRPAGSLKRKRSDSLNKHRLDGTPADEHLPRSLNETCPSTSEGSLQNNNSLNKQSLTTNAKRGRGRPPGAKNKPKTVKLQPKSEKLQTKPSKYLSKQTKAILKKRNALKKRVTKSNKRYLPSNVRFIPKHRFDESIVMLTNPEHPIWEERNASCNKSIHRHWDEYVTASSDHNLRLKFARQFLMRRDWINLSKVLSISLQDVVTHCNSYYSLFTKYASICLAHTDKQQFNKFIQFLLKTEDSEKVLKKCTQFSQNCSDGEEV